MEYTEFDFATIKKLAKLIVGVYTVPPKTSVELFGKAIEQIEKDYLKAREAAKLALLAGGYFNILIKLRNTN